MPEVDQEKLNDAKMLDIAKPPMKDKTFEKFPLMVYRHPKVHYRKQVFKDAHGNVTEETFANEHLTKTVHSEEELAQALKQGWDRNPFVAPPIEVQEDPLYASEPEPPAATVELDSLTKSELIEYASTLGLTLDPSSKKDELIAQIQAA